MNYNVYKSYPREILLLALPILAGNLGQMLISVGDVYVAGHYSTSALGAISVASAIFITFVIAGTGFISGITPVLSNLRGQKIPSKKLFGITVVYSQVIAILIFLLLYLIIPFVYKIGLNEEILNDTVLYLKVLGFSIFGITLFASLKEFLQAYEIVKLPNFLICFSVVINLFLNFLFVFGYGFIPSMGVSGLAYASLIARLLIAFILLAFCFRLFKGSVYRNTFLYIKELIKVGAPISGAMFIEFLGFNIVAVLTGRYETVYAACHNIIVTVVGAFYMVPFSISCALSVKAGFANGAKNIADLRRYIISSLLIVIAFNLFAILCYLNFKEEIIALFSNDKNVIAMGASVMLIVSCFTMFDGIQAVCIGALKGIKKTFQILLVMFLSYIVIAVPVGIYLSEKYGKILQGFWIGLALGLFAASLISSCILFFQYKKIKNSLKL